jgi:hypothetical protein
LFELDHERSTDLLPGRRRARRRRAGVRRRATALAALRDSPLAVERQARAAARMLGFYRATSNWRGRFDHNQLRITRIIKSLRLVSGDAAADAFKAQILALAQGSPINAEALAFWREA